MKANGLRLHQERFRLDTRENFVMEKVVQPWHRVPRAVVESPSVEVFKRHVGTCRHLGTWFSSGLGSAGDNWMQ